MAKIMSWHEEQIEILEDKVKCFEEQYEETGNPYFKDKANNALLNLMNTLLSDTK